MSRYLTDEEKRRELALLAQNQNLDPEIVPYLEQINSLQGICTVQSCAGHKRKDGYQDDGHLWLRMSQSVTTSFCNSAVIVAKHPYITRVARLYQSDGQEIVEICFFGQADGKLEASMQFLVSYLGDLQED